MHKGMAKQRLMRLMKCNKVLVREDFLATFPKRKVFPHAWGKTELVPQKKKSTMCRGTWHVTLQNFPIKHPLCYRYCNNLQNMNKKMPKIKNQDVSQAPSQGLLKPNVVRIDLKGFFRLNKEFPFSYKISQGSKEYLAPIKHAAQFLSFTVVVIFEIKTRSFWKYWAIQNASAVKYQWESLPIQYPNSST